MLIDERRKLLFVHNPKAAGTAVKQALATALGIDRVAALKRYGLGEHLPLAAAVWHLRANGIGLDGYLIVGVLRDPLERLASFWRFGRMTTNDGKGSRITRGLAHLDLSERAAQQMIERVRAYSLERWVRWCIAMSWCPWAEIRSDCSVIERPQLWWFTAEDLSVRLFRSVGDLAAFLAKARGIETVPGRENESGGEQPEFTRWVVDWARETYADDYEALATL